MVGTQSWQALRVLAAVTLAAFAACGGSPLKVADGGSAGQGSAGHAGGAGQASGTPPSCNSLDETTCKTRSDCTPVYCPDCKGGQFFTSCVGPEGGGECPPSCPPDCSTLSETTCKGRSDCHPGYCSSCSGSQVFTQCLDPNEAVACPGYPCPAMPASCDGLNEASCKATPGCGPKYCPNCKGGATFSFCVGPGELASGCPALPCPAPAPCASVTMQAACDARSDCHSVFGWCQSCDCPAPGCPVHFATCADGKKADCKGIACQQNPAGCNGTAYVVSYTADCNNGGCVLPSECGP
jgi:hypothetical protein